MILTFALVIGFSMINDGVDSLYNNRNWAQTNSQVANIYDYGSFKFKKQTFGDIKVGDLVLVERDQDVPADLLLVLSSNESLFVDTSKIDGESTLKQKFPFLHGIEFASIQFLQGMVTCQKPTQSFDQFSGQINFNNERTMQIELQNFLLRGQTLRNTDFCIGIVLFVGKETKLLQNMTNPRLKQSWLLKRMDTFLNFLFLFYLFLILVVWACSVVQEYKNPFVGYLVTLSNGSI